MTSSTEKPATGESHPAPDSPFGDVEFRIVAEDAPVMLWLTNPKGEIIFTNSKWRKFVGAAPGEHVGGEIWLESLHPDDYEQCMRVFEEAFQSHQPFEMEYRLRRHDGQYRDVLDVGEPYIDRQGKFAGFIGSSADITDRKASENQLRRSQQELTHHSREMRLINEMNSYLQVCRTLQETNSIVEHYGSLIFYDCPGVLYLFNEGRSAVEVAAAWGQPDCVIKSFINPDDCWALRQSRVHLVHGADNAITCDHVATVPPGGYVCAPAIAQGEMIGFLYLEIAKSSADDEADKGKATVESRSRLASIAADNLAMALVSLKLREALRSQSVRDPLTRLFNRRYMEETLERELSQCQRQDSPLSVIMIDIDRFKDFNDRFGHDVGDLVLAEVAAIAQAAVRKGDIACRYGGEEFVLVLPQAAPEFARNRARQLAERIRSHEIHHGGKSLQSITISAGVASYPEHGRTPAELVKAADTALYRAKEAGRNRVEIATGD